MEMTSALAHEKVISFEQAQKILDYQKEQLTKDIDFLKQYLSD